MRKVDPLADLVARYFHRQERPTRNPALRSLVDGEDYELAIPDMLVRLLGIYLNLPSVIIPGMLWRLIRKVN